VCFFGFDGFDGVRVATVVAIVLVLVGLVLPSARPLGAISTDHAIADGQATVSSPNANAATTARHLASLTPEHGTGKPCWPDVGDCPR